MAKVEARRYQSDYRSYRNLPIWEIITLENEGILKWRFRPRYIDARVRRAKRHLWKEATMGAH